MSAAAGARREGLFLALACLLALAVRLAWSLRLPPTIVWWDGQQYARLALDLLQHGAYLNPKGHPSALWPPGYPAFMAAVYAVAGTGVTGIRVAQAVLGALTVACVHGIARRVLDPRGARVAALAAALYPLFVYAAGTFFPVTLLVAQLAAVLLLVLVARERRSPGAAALAGALGAWAALTAASSLPALVVCAAWLAWPGPAGSRGAAPGGPRARGAALALAFLLPVALGVGAWTARNVRAVGGPVLVSANGGYNFWLGNYPGVEAETGNDFVSKAMEAEGDSVWFLPGTEHSRDQAFYRLGRRYVAADVPGFVGRTARKALHLWAVYAEPLTKDRPRLPLEALAAWLSYGLLLPLAAGGLLRSLRRDPFATLALALAVVYTAVHAVVLSKIRFRLPLDTLVIVYGAGGLLALWDALAAGWRRARGPAAGAIGGPPARG